ncbi:MAG: hypothetical protein AB8E87_14870 [Prochlorococcus sp.]
MGKSLLAELCAALLPVNVHQGAFGRDVDQRLFVASATATAGDAAWQTCGDDAKRNPAMCSSF